LDPELHVESDTESEEEFDPSTLADDEASPSLSTFLQIGGEHINVTDEMVAHIETMVQTEWEADVEIIAAYTEAHDAWDEVFMRSLTLGRLSFVGAAHYVIQGLAAEHNQAAEIVRHFVKKMDRCEALMENLTEARLRAEQNRFILNAASTKTDDLILSTAKEKHKQLMGEYGPTISSTISPGRKRKTRDSEAFLRRTLKKSRRSSGATSAAMASTVPTKSSFRVSSGSYSGVDTASNSVELPDLPTNGRYRHKSPTVRSFGEPLRRELATTPSAHDLDTPSARTVPPMAGNNSFAEDMECLDN
jgi:hemerythrin-like domain-containing protein